jgi:hypothetical protein
MRKHTKMIAGTAVLAAAGWFAGCNGTVDNEKDVELEVALLTIPTVTAATAVGVCTFTVTQATATFNDKPKNHLAGSQPFNDVVLHDVLVSYVWDDDPPPPALGVSPPQVFGVGGTVPAGGSSPASFAVVNGNVLVAGRDGHTARLVLEFHGKTVGGEFVSATTGGTLTVNSCPP